MTYEEATKIKGIGDEVEDILKGCQFMDNKWSVWDHKNNKNGHKHHQLL